MKALRRYKRMALFDLIVSVLAIFVAVLNRDVFFYVAIAYFAFLAYESLKDYLSLSHH